MTASERTTYHYIRTEKSSEPVLLFLKSASEQFVRNASIAWYFAWSDTKARYKRSVLGPFWLVLSTLIGVVGLGFVWSALTHTGRADFIPALTIGLVLWTMISACLTTSCNTFVEKASVIKNIKTPSSRLSLGLLFQQVINFLHNLLVVAFILILYPQRFSIETLLVIPALFLVLINMWWIVQILGFLGARFRDLNPLMQAIMPILFFISPVLYRARQLGGMAIIMKFNPLAFWIDIVRDPLLGSAPSAINWTANVLLAIFGGLVAILVTRAKMHRLPYWV